MEPFPDADDQEDDVLLRRVQAPEAVAADVRDGPAHPAQVHLTVLTEEMLEKSVMNINGRHGFEREVTIGCASALLRCQGRSVYVPSRGKPSAATGRHQGRLSP
jgi:hypothetical protein